MRNFLFLLFCVASCFSTTNAMELSQDHETVIELLKKFTDKDNSISFSPQGIEYMLKALGCLNENTQINCPKGDNFCITPFCLGYGKELSTSTGICCHSDSKELAKEIKQLSGLDITFSGIKIVGTIATSKEEFKVPFDTKKTRINRDVQNASKQPAKMDVMCDYERRNTQFLESPSLKGVVLDYKSKDKVAIIASNDERTVFDFPENELSQFLSKLLETKESEKKISLFFPKFMQLTKELSIKDILLKILTEAEKIAVQDFDIKLTTQVKFDEIGSISSSVSHMQSKGGGGEYFHFDGPSMIFIMNDKNEVLFATYFNPGS